MTVKELKEILNTMEDDAEIMRVNYACDYSYSDVLDFVTDYSIDDYGDLILK